MKTPSVSKTGEIWGSTEEYHYKCIWMELTPVTSIWIKQNRTEYYRQPEAPSHTLSSHYPIRIITVLISITSDEFELYLTESLCADSLLRLTFVFNIHFWNLSILWHEAVGCSLSILNGIPLCKETKFIHSIADEHLGSFRYF